VGTSFATIAEKDRSTIILNGLCAVEYSVAPRLLLDEGLIFRRRFLWARRTLALMLS